MFGNTGKVGLQSAGGFSKLPSLDFNFMSATLDSRLTYTRATTATDGLYTDASGSSFNSFSSGVPRISAANGLLIEPLTTNFLLNSGAPVTQTTGSLATGNYTLWVIGTGSAAVSAGTATITGAGSATPGVPLVFVVTVAGTVTVTVTGSLTRFQLENQPGATSYIPTAGATANRAFDSVSMPIGSWFNASQGSFAVEALVPFQNTVNNSIVVEVDDGTLSNRNGFNIAASTKHCTSNIVTAGVSASSVGTSGSMANGVQFRGAASYSGSGQVCALNGTVTVKAALPAGGLPTVTTLRIGQLTGSSTNVISGFVHRMRYWPRELSSTELASVST